MPGQVENAGPEIHGPLELPGEDRIGSRDSHPEIDVVPIQQIRMVIAGSVIAGPVGGYWSEGLPRPAPLRRNPQPEEKEIAHEPRIAPLTDEEHSGAAVTGASC
jgi:hypothetical protein